jgi:hypothetical protein
MTNLTLGLPADAIAVPVPGFGPDLTGLLSPAVIALDVLALATAGVIVVARNRRCVRRLFGALALGLGLTLGAAPAQAADADSLQCYRVTDATLKRLRATVDLDAAATGLAPGCRLSRPKLFCTPARQTVREASNGSIPVTELPYQGPPAATDRICYDVKCPVAATPDRTVTDRFGTHTMRRLQTSMVCTPAVAGTQPPPTEGFQVTTPQIEISPGQDVTYCYFFRTNNAGTMAIKRFTSEMGPAGKGVVFFTTTENDIPAERRPIGSVSIVGCDLFYETTRPNWRYAGYGTSDELVFPNDDGEGRPLANEIEPQAAGVLMMHFKNETAETVTSRVTLTAEGVGTPIYTPTATLLSYDGSIAIPAFATGHSESLSCPIPSGAKFWNASTFAHKQAKLTLVRDGNDSPLFLSADFRNPGAARWDAPDFYTFASGSFGHACTYDNPFNRIIRNGSSQQTEEQCIGVGWFFPATRPRLCWDGYAFP